MLTVTPGIVLLLRGLTIYVGPTILLIAATKQLASTRDISLPTWFLVIVGLLAIPAYSVVRIATSEFKLKRDAAAMGCQLVPRIRGKKLANIDILWRLLESWEADYPGEAILDIVKEMGPVIDMHVLYDSSIFTICPEHIKIILATDFNNYVKGENFSHSMADVLGTGVFNSDGDMWKFHRSMTRPFFSRDRISHYELFDRHADIAILKIKERMRSGFAIDFQDLMGRFTLDSATEFLFGSCVHSLSGRLPYPHNASFVSEPSLSANSHIPEEFAHAFLHAQEVISKRERAGWTWPLAEIFRNATEEPMKVVNAFVEPIIKDAIEKRRIAKAQELTEEVKNANEVGENDTLLDHLAKQTSDPVVLKDETLNIMLAGRDTTAATLTFIIYFLSMYPEVTTRLRREILDKVGSTRRPTYDDIRDMKYLRAVINETLRLYPVVPFNIRSTVHATTWPAVNPSEKPYYIPAQTKVPYSVFLMHRRKDLWGPDAEEFDPDRFLDERLQKYLIHNSFIFLPFNAGPRICLGQQFAYNEMSFMVIRLLQNFSSLSLDLDAQPPSSKPDPAWANSSGRKAVEKFWPRTNLTMYSLGGLWVRMNEAPESAE
ncbi:hypothetical protein HGRIS_007241 [Hohenbuehelia grisea]|uniref:Cytochrome P450 n=1 Tax=Hohenbuehelia grisea TaxID=104357 RepID=A0ABR3JBL2_9AGAR